MALLAAFCVIDDPVRMSIFASQNACSAGRAKGCCRECLEKLGAFPRDTIDVRSPRKRMAGAPQVVPAEIIDQNENDVWLGRGCGSKSCRCGSEPAESSRQILGHGVMLCS